jgi:hypothetical protein
MKNPPLSSSNKSPTIRALVISVRWMRTGTYSRAAMTGRSWLMAERVLLGCAVCVTAVTFLVARASCGVECSRYLAVL